MGTLAEHEEVPFACLQKEYTSWIPDFQFHVEDVAANMGSIVQEYDPTHDGTYSPRQVTFEYSSRIQKELQKNGVSRPKGYTVSWHSNPEAEGHHFGPTHPMKPFRLTLTKSLVMAYGMHEAMDCYLSRAATREELLNYHIEDYVDFLLQVTPDNIFKLYPGLEENTGYTSSVFGVGDDCPIFDGLGNYASLYAGATIDAARKLGNNQSDIAINWSGGLHHAQKTHASGFCYVNDIVLGILQLLRTHARVLYIDIDVHHGDGVENAFWSTDRVFCISFHKYDPETFFPGTGPLESQGPSHPDNPGKKHTINVPLQDGIDDESYKYLFEAVVGETIRRYDPKAIVLQCGADSLGHDRLGMFNLNIKGHGNCVKFVKTFDKPLLVVGGGGYTPRNVARAWAHETSICIGADDKLDPNLPEGMPFRNAFDKEGPTLFPNLGNWKHQNANSPQYLEKILESVREQLRYLKGAPSVQMSHIPPDLQGWREDLDERRRAALRQQEEIKEERDGAGGPIAKAGRRRQQERGTLARDGWEDGGGNGGSGMLTVSD